MTIDERIEKLTEDQAQIQVILAGVLRSIKRLERIAVVDVLEDIEARLTELEARARRE